MKKTISAVLSAVAAILLITMARAADASQLVTYTSYTLPDSVFAKPVQDTPPVYNLYRRSTAADTVQARALGVPVYPVVIDREITPAAATDTLVVGTYENLYISSGAIVYVQGWVYTKKLCTIKPGAITLIEPNGILGLLEGGKVGAPGQDLVQVLGSMAADPGFGSKLPVIVCGIGLGGTSSVDEVVVAGFKRPGYFSLAGMGVWLENKSPGAVNTTEVRGLYATDNRNGFSCFYGPNITKLQNSQFWNNSHGDLSLEEVFQFDVINCRLGRDDIDFLDDPELESRIVFTNCALPPGFIYRLLEKLVSVPWLATVVKMQETRGNELAQIWPTTQAFLEFDFDLGGEVDISDFRILASVFGQERAGSLYYYIFGDMDEDGRVGVPDIIHWGIAYTGNPAVESWPDDGRGRHLLLTVLEYPEIVAAAMEDPQFGPAVARVAEMLHPTAVEDDTALPLEFSLAQNHPNPFNSATTINYALAQAGGVQLLIYDLVGQVVRTLVDAPQAAGQYTITWDGQSDSGESVSSGNYILALRAGANQFTKHLLLLK